MLSLLMTSLEIQDEVLPLCSPGVKLYVEVHKRDRRWEAAFVQDSADASSQFRIPRLLAPRDYCQNDDRLCFLWSKSTPAWKGNLLLKCLNSLTWSVAVTDDLTVSVTIRFTGRSVDVSLLPRETKNDGYPKLKSKILRKLQTTQRVDRRLFHGIALALCKL
jgi:hypothetical protein